jgi:hypothetical protein
MVAFVKSHADFNARKRELNQQLTKSLIILVETNVFFPIL